ncbi:ABC transporter permease [Streptomyces sp. Act143]|uniref:ABC transporter permease n=1 Tax=Streptomyces sp. Act143 TaxID=2200760 RepID=UPI000D673E07|nr:ABC transporter permease [Streptomyces sp. Act143]PWI16456.1 ABC transporter permease [Streptomyces sp. Act143]
MSAVLEAAPAAPQTQSRTSSAAVLALARFEARRLLTTVPVILGFLVYAAWIVWRGLDYADGYPALQDADRATQGGPLFVGLAVLLAVNQAVLRSRRRDTERHFTVLVMTQARRTAAHLLSVVPAVLLTAVCVAGQFGWQALKPGALGHGSPGELLVGPLTVLAFGAAGVLLARLVRTAFTAPLVVVFILFLFLLSTGAGIDEGWTRWLTPVIGTASADTLPSDLIGRPAGWHALYLAALGLTVALLAMLAGGGHRARSVYAGCVGALALTVLGAVAQGQGVSADVTAARERATLHPEQVQTCVERDGSRYCAFPEWRGRTADWARTVAEVQSLAGGAAHDQALLVRQRIDARYGLDGDAALDPATTPHQVTVSTAWGGNRIPEFSAAVAGVLVTGDEKTMGELCDGRMVTIMWLALAGQSDPIDSFKHVRLDDSLSGSAIVLSQTNPLTMTAGQTTVVRKLLEQPRDAVAAKVKANWAELTSPKVTTARAAELLGVTGKVGADKCD